MGARIFPLPLRTLAGSINSSYNSIGTLIITVGEGSTRVALDGKLTPKEVEDSLYLAIEYNRKFGQKV